MRSWLLSGAICLAILSGSPTFAALSGSNASDSSQSYIVDAKRQIDSGNLNAAEIQLKNALKGNPNDASARLLLGDVYLRLGNAPAAEAEIRVARQRGAADDTTAPLLGRALLAQGKLNELFQQVPPANRSNESEGAVRLVLGEANMSLGQFDKAGALIDQAEKLDPNNLGIMIAKARLFAVSKQFDTASAEIEQVLARDPNRVDALMLKGGILSANGKFDDAIKSFDAALKLAPENALTHVGRASTLVAAGRPDDAQKELDGIFARQPVPAQAYYLRALLLTKQSKFSDADAALLKMGPALAQSPEYSYLQAAVKLALKQYEQADDLATKVLARNLQSPSARKLVARVALAKGDTKRAISTLDSLTGADSKDSEALVLMAQAYATSKNLDKSLEYYQRAATLSPNNAGMQTRLALLQMNAGRVDEGIADLDKLSQNDESAKVAGPVLVLSSLQLGKVEEADRAAKQMVERSPTDPTSLNLLGMVKVAQKDYSGAEKIFNDTIKANPNFSAAQRNLAAMYAITDRSNDAQKVYRKILKANPSDVQALMGLGNLAVKNNNIEQAAQYFKSAQDASPQDPTPGMTLLNLYNNRQQWQKAAEFGRSLASKFPSSVPVAEALVQAQSGGGDITSALASAHHLTELAPKSPVAWQENARAQLASNDLPGARLSFQQALTLAPTDARIKEAIVEVDYRMSGVDGALKTAQTFAKDDPVVGDILSAQILKQAGRSADAVALLQKSQQARPDARTVLVLAAALRQEGHIDIAEGALKDWITHHASDSAAHQLLGETYLVDGQYDPAIAEFETVERAQPNNVAILNNLSIAYQHKNDPRAREVAEKAYAIAPTVPAVADTLGWILLSAGDTAAALPYLESAAGALSNNMDVQYHLAVALQRAGQSEEARKVLERVTASTQPFENKKDAEKLLVQLQQG